MINFTNSLYRTQWLDLVFHNRNKSYGAYALRHENNKTTIKALFSACIFFTLMIVLPWLLRKQPLPVPHIELPVEKLVELDLAHLARPTPPLPPPASASSAAPVRTVQLTSNMVVAPAEAATFEIPPIEEIAISTIGQTTTAGTEVTGNAQPTTENVGNGTAEMNAPTDAVHDLVSLEIYPEFPGGQEAFLKFIGRNIRYPSLASESGIQGTVIVRFIIERDGSLSDIKILRGVGGGCDEEAIRVLKKSPDWRPGQQNNQKVRVAYTLPVTFKLP